MFYLLPPDLPSKFLCPNLCLRMLSFMSCINRTTSSLASSGFGQWARLTVTVLGFLPVCSLHVSWDPLLPFLVPGEGGWFFSHPEKTCPYGSRFLSSICARLPNLDRGLYSMELSLLRGTGESEALLHCMPDAWCWDQRNTYLFCPDVMIFVLSFLYMSEKFFSLPIPHPQSSYDSCCFKIQLALFKVCGYLLDKYCRPHLSLTAFKANSGEQKNRDPWVSNQA